MNAIEVQLDSPFYVTGGTLSRDALSYVTRQADQELYDALRKGDFSYVLTARQMGKSSLMVRTASRLRDEGVSVVVLDLTAIGQNLSAEQWYGGLLTQMAHQLGLEEELEEFWDAHPGLGPLQRWMQAVRRVVLPRSPGRVVIFIDEIDAVRSLPFSTDEFFAGIREFYNHRTQESALDCLSVCLLGVAAPSDLIRDTRMTPFNIGKRIELHDFTRAEAQVLAFGLSGGEQKGSVALNRIIYWTGGHPYLTQRLCQAVAEHNPQSSINYHQLIDRLCGELFFSSRAREQDDNLLFVRERILRSEVELAGLLSLYDQVHRDKNTPDDETNPLISVLRLSGIVRVEEGLLQLRNRVYYRVFDQAWVATNMPDADVRRQRAAYRKGLLRAAAIAMVILMAMASLVFVAIRQRNFARAAEETNRQQLYAAQMNLAAQAWDDAGVARMLDLLNNHVPKAGQEDLRGFEWYHLWGLGHGDLRSFHKGDALAATFFPDSQRLVTGGADHQLRVWNIITGEQLMILSGHTGEVWSVDVSPDGKILASASTDNTARIWNAVTGQEIATVSGQKDEFLKVVFCAEGNKLATSGADDTVKLWDVPTLNEFVTLRPLGGEPNFAVSPDGKTVATGTVDGVATIWDATTGKELRRLSGHGGAIFTLTFSPDGTTLVVGGGNSLAKFWDLTTGKLIPAPGSAADLQSLPKVIKATQAIMSVSFSPDGRILAVASYDRTVKLYSSATLQLLNTLRGHERSVESVTFSRNGRLLVTVGRDGLARLWDAGDTQEPSISSMALGNFLSVAFSPDGCCLATAGFSGQVPRLWDLKTRQEIRSFSGHKSFTMAVAFSPDGRLLATGSNDKTAKIWDVATGQEILTLDGDDGKVQILAFSPDGRHLATGSGDKIVKTWDVATGQEIGTLSVRFNDQPDIPLSFAYSPDGQLLANGDDKTLRLWDVITRKEVASLQHSSSVFAIAFSPDGKTLAVGLVNGQIRLWDLSTRQEVLTLKGHVSHVNELVFFPDGKRLASGSAGDNTARIWNVASGQELISFRHSSQVSALAVSPMAG